MKRMLEQQQQNNPRGPSIMNKDNDILTAAQSWVCVKVNRNIKYII